MTSNDFTMHIENCNMYMDNFTMSIATFHMYARTMYDDNMSLGAYIYTVLINCLLVIHNELRRQTHITSVLARVMYSLPRPLRIIHTPADNVLSVRPLLFYGLRN
jgi:hypothetical protein